MIVPMPPAFDLLAEPPSGVFHYGQSSWGPNPLGTCFTESTIMEESKNKKSPNESRAVVQTIIPALGPRKKKNMQVPHGQWFIYKDN